MRRHSSRVGFVFSLFAMSVLFAAGCGQAQDRGGQAEGKKEADPAKSTPAAGKKPHVHGEWWCAEHGIPEEVCSLCSEKAAAEFKKRGDWCDLHDRAKSQCFLCNPKLKERYAAKYRARYGKEPPPIEEELPQDGEKK